jgi:ABC-type branched-subunit amino acid transport system permease subunit
MSGSMLAYASAISLYWGLVGIDGSLGGFEWLALAMFGLLSSGLGFAGSLNALRKKNQAFVILTVILPLAVNVVVVKAQMDAYSLLVPWISIVASVLLTVTGGLLLCNADESFSEKTPD